MKVPPTLLDGAHVRYWAWSGEIPFGFIESEDRSQRVAIYGLAICAYPEGQRVYRFSCDENWAVINDFDYDSVEEAVERLPQQYRSIEPIWQAFD